MSDDKSIILNKIAAGIQEGHQQETGGMKSRLKHAKSRIAAHNIGLIPKRVSLSHNKLVELFTGQANAAHATHDHINHLNDAPKAIAKYLNAHGLAPDIWISKQSPIQKINWRDAPLNISDDHDISGKKAAVNMPDAGVAETGTLVFTSSSMLAIGQNFLPDTHIAILRLSDIVACYEDVWTLLRHRRDAHAGEGGNRGIMPRALTMVTGPSRTGDIAQTLELGAHGPVNLHILIADKE